jgi:hypothetical protein
MGTNERSGAWFEDAWEFREETLYCSLFGDVGPGIYALDTELFTTQFRQASIDPRWVTHGVFESHPTATRRTWVYVSSGLSNAWDADSPNPNDTSGLGCEFILECPSQSQWALVLLRSMVAFQILLAAGRFPGKGPLQTWDRVPLRAPIDGASSALDWLLLAPSSNFGEIQQLPSGQFIFLQFIGITKREAAYARKNGSDTLLQLLRERGAAPVTDPRRQEILHH